MAITTTLTNATGQAVYPKTLASSVNYDATRTADALLGSGIYADSDGEETSVPELIDANTLDGRDSNYYAKTSAIKLLQTQIDSLDKKLINLKSDLDKYSSMYNSVGFHNSTYRGKDITSYLTDGSLFTKISDGSFDDLFIGDYFTMNITVDGYSVICKKYVLCGFNTYNNMGNDNVLTRNHAVVMPAGNLFIAPMNATDISTGGYYNSNMHKVIMPKIATGIQNVIGSAHLITYQDLLSTAISDGKPSAWAWYDTICRLCSELEVSSSVRQLPIFRLYPKFCQNDDSSQWWLSSIPTSTGFHDCDSNGFISWATASTSKGVRPRFLIG